MILQHEPQLCTESNKNTQHAQLDVFVQQIQDLLWPYS